MTLEKENYTTCYVEEFSYRYKLVSELNFCPKKLQTTFKNYSFVPKQPRFNRSWFHNLSILSKTRSFSWLLLMNFTWWVQHYVKSPNQFIKSNQSIQINCKFAMVKARLKFHTAERNLKTKATEESWKTASKINEAKLSIKSRGTFVVLEVEYLRNGWVKKDGVNTNLIWYISLNYKNSIDLPALLF